ncbi:fas-binding factor 1 homolog [Rhynochetos jubatus]
MRSRVLHRYDAAANLIPYREEVRAAELLGRSSVAKLLEQAGTGERREFRLGEKSQKQPEKEEGWHEEDFVFGAYQPTVASLPRARLTRRQPASGFSAENSSEPKPEPQCKPPPPASRSSVQSGRAGSDWLGLEDDFMELELSSPAKAESLAPGLLRDRRPGAPAAQLCEDTSACQAALLSTQARVAELESQVRMLELERTQHKLLLESLQQRRQEELDLLESTHRSRMKVMEETYRQREQRLRQEKEQLAAQLLSQSQDAERARAELVARQQQHVATLEQQSRLELERLQELHRVSVQEMRRDHEEQLQRLKRLKDQEIDAVTSATSHTRSLNRVTEQMEKFCSDLHKLLQKAEATHHTASQELTMEARQRDRQLKVLQDRLLQQQKDMEEEGSRLQEVIAEMEARQSQQTRLLGSSACDVDPRAPLQALKQREQRLRQEKEQLAAQLLSQSQDAERARAMRNPVFYLPQIPLIQASESLMCPQVSVQEMRRDHEEQLQRLKRLKDQEIDAVTSATWHTRSLNRVTEQMEDRLLQQQKDMEEEGSRLQEVIAEMEARQSQQTRAELKIRGRELKAKEEQLARDRELLDKASQELRLEREKKYEEGEQALREASRMESESQSRLQVMQQHLEQLKQQEQRLHQERLSMAHQRRQLEELREQLPSNPVRLLTADQGLGASTDNLAAAGRAELCATLPQLKHDAQQGSSACDVDPRAPLQALKLASSANGRLSWEMRSRVLHRYDAAANLIPYRWASEVLHRAWHGPAGLTLVISLSQAAAVCQRVLAEIGGVKAAQSPLAGEVRNGQGCLQVRLVAEGSAGINPSDAEALVNCRAVTPKWASEVLHRAWHGPAGLTLVISLSQAAAVCQRVLAEIGGVKAAQSRMEGTGGQSARAEPPPSDQDTLRSRSSAPGLMGAGAQPVLEGSGGTPICMPVTQPRLLSLQATMSGVPSTQTTVAELQLGSPGIKTTPGRMGAKRDWVQFAGWFWESISPRDTQGAPTTLFEFCKPLPCSLSWGHLFSSDSLKTAISKQLHFSRYLKLTRSWL